ncbi:flavin oxidoreductase nadh oxidase, partial [Moniliophthora roreri]
FLDPCIHFVHNLCGSKIQPGFNIHSTVPLGSFLARVEMCTIKCTSWWIPGFRNTSLNSSRQHGHRSKVQTFPAD